MLTSFDDYPIHQTAEPVAQPATGDRNFYDRYFFNGYSRDGDLFFAAALGLYPNRRVMDAAFSVVRDGRQHVVRASRLRARRAARDARRADLRRGARAAARAARARVAETQFGLSADLAFYARTAAIEEPRFTFRNAGRLVMDSTRLTQFGLWEGYIRLGDEEIADLARIGRPARAIAPGACARSASRRAARPACRRSSSGCGRRSTSTTAARTPPSTRTRRAAAGTRAAASRPPAGSTRRAPRGDGARSTIASAGSPGTRRAAGAEITPRRRTAAAADRRSLEPILTFQMRGLGYLDPEWGHGMWKGEEAVDGVTWTLADLDPMDPRHIHVQQLCRARIGAEEGLGVLEQLVIGPHARRGSRRSSTPRAVTAAVVDTRRDAAL